MHKIFFLVLSLLLVGVIYKGLSFLYFQRLKHKLKDGDIDTFKKLLGQNYQYRDLYNGLTRCKWFKGWLVIKANFNEEGKLICSRIIPYNFLRLRSEMLFSA